MAWRIEEEHPPVILKFKSEKRSGADDVTRAALRRGQSKSVEIDA